MNITKEISKVNWLRTLLFYGIILAGTYFARRQPNLLNLLLEKVTDIPFSFNYNHGMVTLIVSLLFYRLSSVKQTITLLGNSRWSLLFPILLLVCYAGYGMENNRGIEKHLWALIVCSFALLYNILEEYAWRGYLIDSSGRLSFMLKSIISGVFWCCWHLLVFNSFDQYGGFTAFFAFCMVFSFILTFAVLRTRSIIVAAAIHAFLIQVNIVALVCLVLFMLLLLVWNKIPARAGAKR